MLHPLCPWRSNGMVFARTIGTPCTTVAGRIAASDLGYGWVRCAARGWSREAPWLTPASGEGLDERSQTTKRDWSWPHAGPGPSPPTASAWYSDVHWLWGSGVDGSRHVCFGCDLAIGWRGRCDARRRGAECGA